MYEIILGNAKYCCFILLHLQTVTLNHEIYGCLTTCISLIHHLLFKGQLCYLFLRKA